jgi:hypothetical protein
MYLVNQPYSELYRAIVSEAMTSLRKCKPSKGLFSHKASQIMALFFPIMDLILKLEKQNKNKKGVECYSITPSENPKSDSIIWRGWKSHEVVHEETNPSPDFNPEWKVVILKDNGNNSRRLTYIYFKIDGIMFLVTGIYLIMKGDPNSVKNDSATEIPTAGEAMDSWRDFKKKYGPFDFDKREE